MPIPMQATAVLDRYFLEMRSKVLDVAAALDRLERAEGADQQRDDPRLAHLRRAISVLLDGKPDRAARVQVIFSDPYRPDWARPEVPGSE